MKKFLRLFLLSSALLLAVQCFEEHGIDYDYIYVIPEEDRFTFDEGDTLLYRNSEGVIDSVRVKEVTFYTEPGAGINFFGVTYVYMMDHYKVTLEALDDRWAHIIESIYEEGEGARCLTIESSFDQLTYSEPDELPGTILYLGCGEFGGPVIADSDPVITEQLFNGTTYRNIYPYKHSKGDSASLDIYWNLKYGIIHFGGIIDQSYIYWDLEGSL